MLFYFLYMMTMGMFFKNDYVNLLDLARSKTKQELDIKYILKEVNDIKKIKKILMDED